MIQVTDNVRDPRCAIDPVYLSIAQIDRKIGSELVAILFQRRSRTSCARVRAPSFSNNSLNGGFHRAFGDAEACRNVLIGEPLKNGAQHGAIPLREFRTARTAACGPRSGTAARGTRFPATVRPAATRRMVSHNSALEWCLCMMPATPDWINCTASCPLIPAVTTRIWPSNPACLAASTNSSAASRTQIHVQQHHGERPVFSSGSASAAEEHWPTTFKSGSSRRESRQPFAEHRVIVHQQNSNLVLSGYSSARLAIPPASSTAKTRARRAAARSVKSPP